MSITARAMAVASRNIRSADFARAVDAFHDFTVLFVHKTHLIQIVIVIHSRQSFLLGL
jgi:hypothetical protein